MDNYKMTVLVDTREKNWEHIQRYFEKAKIPYKQTKLLYGDYSLLLECKKDGFTRQYDLQTIFAIERKANIDELIQNVARKEYRRRFYEEIKRKDIYNARMDIIIEDCDWYSKVVKGNYISTTPIKAVRGYLAEVQSCKGVSLTGIEKDLVARYIVDRLIYQAKKFIEKN